MLEWGKLLCNTWLIFPSFVRLTFVKNNILTPSHSQFYFSDTSAGGNGGNRETLLPTTNSVGDRPINEIFVGNDNEDQAFWVLFPAFVTAISNLYRVIKENGKMMEFDGIIREPSKDVLVESLNAEERFSKRATALDSIGGGHLLKRALDSIGGGYLLKRAPALDSIGGGHLLKRALDSIGGGHLLKRVPILDQIGGGHLLKRESTYDRFYQSPNPFKRRPILDSIGGGHLLKRSPQNEEPMDFINNGNIHPEDNK